MTALGQPLVTVLTPVYNGADFLADCIESVLTQTYQHYEYIIVNNRSTDRTLDIALDYAKKDRRIRVVDNEQFVPVIENHNIAFRLVSAEAKYCKVVSADDFLFPTAIARMVALAEANPSVGIVGSYQLSGDRVLWQGFKFPRAVFSGVEMCRRVFLGGDRGFGFGSPTSMLYRADLVRSDSAFYPNPSPHSDTSACFRALRHADYGFVYDVLSFERTHGETQSSASAAMNRYSSANLDDAISYGPWYLNQEELARRLDDVLKSYHRFLAVNYFCASRGKDFWSYHKGRLEELGYPLSRASLYKAAILALISEALNPAQAIRKLKNVGRPVSRTSPAAPTETTQAGAAGRTTGLPTSGEGHA